MPVDKVIGASEAHPEPGCSRSGRETVRGVVDAEVPAGGILDRVKDSKLVAVIVGRRVGNPSAASARNALDQKLQHRGGRRAGTGIRGVGGAAP